jgi:YHS domain-containing protein
VVDEMVQDPFCKTYIPRREAVRRRVGGQEHFFCSEECARKFEAQEKG